MNQHIAGPDSASGENNFLQMPKKDPLGALSLPNYVIPLQALNPDTKLPQTVNFASAGAERSPVGSSGDSQMEFPGNVDAALLGLPSVDLPHYSWEKSGGANPLPNPARLLPGEV